MHLNNITQIFLCGKSDILISDILYHQFLKKSAISFYLVFRQVPSCFCQYSALAYTNFHPDSPASSSISSYECCDYRHLPEHLAAYVGSGDQTWVGRLIQQVLSLGELFPRLYFFSTTQSSWSLGQVLENMLKFIVTGIFRVYKVNEGPP